MPGTPPNTLTQLYADLSAQSTTAAQDTPGQLIDDIIAVAGGVTTLGQPLGPNVATSVSWIAIGTGSQAWSPRLTALAVEVCRVPVFGVAVADIAACVALVAASVGNGWWTEVGVFGGSGTSVTPGSGGLYGYVGLPLPVLKHGGRRMIVQWTSDTT
jgi:hypothetical protein